MSYPYGLAPVLRDASQLSPASPADPPFVPLDRLSKQIPDSDLVKAAAAHVKPLLGDKLWNHSHRAFLFGPSSSACLLSVRASIARTRCNDYPLMSNTRNSCVHPPSAIWRLGVGCGGALPRLPLPRFRRYGGEPEEVGQSLHFVDVSVQGAPS